MGRPEREERCRRHPKHRESKGVCPFCLREKLSHLSISSSSSTANLSSTTTSSSPCSSDSNHSSAAASPRRRDPDGRKPLTKSRSLAFVLSRERKEEEKEKKEEEKGRKKKKKGSFWSKLMDVGSARRKEEGGLMHSKTLKESSTKWVLFS